MRSMDDFFIEILNLRTETVQNTAYGANVIPVIELYKKLSRILGFFERKNFKHFLEEGSS